MHQALTDTRNTSASHPQANAPAEKAVHVVKAALIKMCLPKKRIKDWDLEVRWLLLGYRCSPQQSTGFSPDQLIFAHTPVIPPAVHEDVSIPISFVDPALPLQLCLGAGQ